MDAILSLLPQVQLSPLQRVLLIYAFVAVGFVIAAQVSRLVTDRPPQWATQNQLFWRTIYVLEAFLFVQIGWRHWLPYMEGYAFGYEEQILNGLWLGLLGLEAAMVVGVVVKNLLGGASARGEKVKEL